MSRPGIPARESVNKRIDVIIDAFTAVTKSIGVTFLSCFVFMFNLVK